MDSKSAKMTALAELIKRLFRMESKEHAGTPEGDELLAGAKHAELPTDDYLEPDMEMTDKGKPLADIMEPKEDDYRSEMRRGGKLKPHGRASKGIAMAIEVHKPKLASMGRGK